MNDLLDSPPSSPHTTRYFRRWVALLWCILIVFGFLFRVSHWPFAAELILGGSAGLCAYAVSGFIWLRGKHALNTLMTIVSVVWVGFLIFGMLSGGLPLGAEGLLFYAEVFVPVFVICVVVNSMKRR